MIINLNHCQVYSNRNLNSISKIFRKGRIGISSNFNADEWNTKMKNIQASGTYPHDSRTIPPTQDGSTHDVGSQALQDNVLTNWKKCWIIIVTIKQRGKILLFQVMLLKVNSWKKEIKQC